MSILRPRCKTQLYSLANTEWNNKTIYSNYIFLYMKIECHETFSLVKLISISYKIFEVENLLSYKSLEIRHYLLQLIHYYNNKNENESKRFFFQTLIIILFCTAHFCSVSTHLMYLICNVTGGVANFRISEYSH